MRIGYRIFIVMFSFLWLSPAYGVRIKDVADIKGVRTNPLIGYGLVVGLEGTGDGKKVVFTTQSLTSMLQRMGVSVDPDKLKVGNVAAVMVTGDLPPFARSGSRIDVAVASIGDAKSLQGGTLLLTPMKAANGKIYAAAQGPVSIGGFSGGGAGAGIQKNFLTAGRISDGGVIEKSVESDFTPENRLTLVLKNPDFTTASRIARAVNAVLPEKSAISRNPATVEVDIPEQYSHNIVELVTLVESLSIVPDTPARVVINEKTGTVVIGENVRISTVAVAHGNLTIEVKERPDVSQPPPLSRGRTVVTPNTEVKAEEEQNRVHVIQSGVSISDLVSALNALGVSPRDLIAIFQAIKAAGALQGELEII